MSDTSGGRCRLCGRSFLVSHWLGVCADCLRDRPERALRLALEVQDSSRREFGLPVNPPRDLNGVHCHLCGNQCSISEGERGYCGLRANVGGKLRHLGGTPARGILHWYYDPLPTNCVAAWVCEGSERRGQNNLAVFYGACTFNCLFCQNWQHREMSPEGPAIRAHELAGEADARTFCVCYFGGDPSAQMLHALATSRVLAERGVKVCWETNGSMHPALLDKALQFSLETGGCVKFDLKAYDDNLHTALTGVSNRRTLLNFARAAQWIRKRPDPPLLVASTLLVPGYVDTQEVSQLATFIASLDPTIPYSLLGFYPHFYMADLPRTSVGHAEECEHAAREAGLFNVHIGNRQMLSRDY
jgi:pyruvate formate lyase activating enzyme